jgi:aerobic-type carbon monoxide dehydrogenase small subunit (CoxS/CutS family)
MPGISVVVNGVKREIASPADTPLLYVLRNELELSGPQFGCGQSQCGACSVLVDGKETRSCTLPLNRVAGKEVITLEGLPARWAGQRGIAASESLLHPVQQAWIDEQVPACGYCQNGQILTAKALLDKTPNPTDAQIRQGMASTLCRCMTYYRIQAAIKRAAKAMVTA